MKTSLLFTTAAVAMALYALPGTGLVSPADGAKEPAAALVLQGKKPAGFTHSTHTGNGIGCGTCHHDGKHQPLTKEAIEVLPDPAVLQCLSCHNERHPQEQLRQAKDIFHARCKTCHQEGWQGKNGPVKCSGCHLQSGKKAPEGC